MRVLFVHKVNEALPVHSSRGPCTVDAYSKPVYSSQQSNHSQSVATLYRAFPVCRCRLVLVQSPNGLLRVPLA